MTVTFLIGLIVVLALMLIVGIIVAAAVGRAVHQQDTQIPRERPVVIHRTGRPSVPDLSHVYIEDEQRLLEYVDGEWRPVPEERLADAPSVVDVLRAHAWDAKKEACSCGWDAPVGNHPIHQAHMLTYRSLVWPPAAEYIMDRPR